MILQIFCLYSGYKNTEKSVAMKDLVSNEDFVCRGVAWITYVMSILALIGLIGVIFLHLIRYRIGWERSFKLVLIKICVLSFFLSVDIVGQVGVWACFTKSDLVTDEAKASMAHLWRVSVNISIYITQVGFGFPFAHVIWCSLGISAISIALGPIGLGFYPWIIVFQELDMLVKGLIAAYQRESIAKLTFLLAWIECQNLDAETQYNITGGTSDGIVRSASNIDVNRLGIAKLAGKLTLGKERYDTINI
jgi:hypothetical protein